MRRSLDNNNVQPNQDISTNTSENNTKDTVELILRRKQFDIFKNKPFWIEDIAAHNLEDE